MEKITQRTAQSAQAEWTRNLTFVTFLALALSGCSQPESTATASTEVKSPAIETQTQPPADLVAIHKAALVLDGHADVLLPDTPRRYYRLEGDSRTSLQQLQAGQVDAIVFSIAVGPGAETAEATAKAQQEAQAKLASVQQYLAQSQGQAELATTAEQVKRLHNEGKVAVLLGFQNARILGSDLAAFKPYYDAGVRLAGLTHAGHNSFADSSRPVDEAVERHKGLSDLGRQSVRYFNQLGVLIDVSQLSEAALLQTLELSEAPVVASHSNVWTLVENSRNLNDKELDAIKQNGGVVLLVPFNAYLRNASEAASKDISQLRLKFGLSEQFEHPADQIYEKLDPEQLKHYSDELLALESRASVADYVDHIDYVVKRLGDQHAGIGSDFNHGAGIRGFNSPTEAQNVTAELIRRGYSQAQIDAIWGGNFLRVLAEAQAKASPQTASAG